MSPEIISHHPYLGPPTDIWSLGVLIFGMVVGFLPFYSPPEAPPEDSLERRILRGKFRIPSSVSPPVRDLFQRALVTNPDARITLRDMYNHPWLRETAAQTSAAEEDHSFIDEEALAVIESSLGHTRTVVLEAIRDEDISDITAGYFLLAAANRKKGVTLHPEL